MRVSLLLCSLFATALTASAADLPAWSSWRGPSQNGVSPERFVDYSFPEKPSWTYKQQGRGTPVILDGRLFSFSYKGKGEELVEYLTAHDAVTGDVVWQHKIHDFISDTVYGRYAIGAPTIDPETKKVYLMTTHGVFRCYTFDGVLEWEISMMERFGRLTFPNGRAGSALIEGDLVIVRGITAYWGKQGPARDRFFGFDKKTGELVWASTPGIGPKDSSFSTPIFETRDGMRVFYVGTGCGQLVAVNGRNGEPLFRFPMSFGGVNSSPVIYKDTVIAIHGKENLDSSEEGRMVAVRIPKFTPGAEQQVLGKESEVWRNGLVMFSSSPVLVGDRLYQLTKTGTLACVNADTGEIIWEEKLSNSNLHSSPIYADGLLYVPMNDGALHVIRPSDEGIDTLAKLELEGSCLGAPALYNGHLYVHTTKMLYAFKLGQTAITASAVSSVEIPKPGKAAALQIVPNDVLLRQGVSQEFRVRKVDVNGFVVGEANPAELEWASFIPPTAKVKAKMDATFEGGKLIVSDKAKTSAGAFMAKGEGLKGIVRGRVLPSLPYTEDFESYALTADASDGAKFSFPPLSWIGARFKFDIREQHDTKLFAKTLDRVLFQRATAFIGDPDLANYTLQADVMSEGNRRSKMDVGLVNQRYAIVLKGNYNQIEISSNHERLKRSVPFQIKANAWYTMKSSVERNADGSGTVHAKVWLRDTEEPAEWTFSLELPYVHEKGAPGLFGFALQNQMKVFIDNVSITSNK